MTVAHNGARARRAASGLIVFAMIATLAAPGRVSARVSPPWALSDAPAPI